MQYNYALRLKHEHCDKFVVVYFGSLSTLYVVITIWPDMLNLARYVEFGPHRASDPLLFRNAV